MDKYDLKAKYDKNQAYNLDDLAEEIVRKSGTSYKVFDGYSKDEKVKYIKSKFTNDDRSGIIDKLYDSLNFDIERIGEEKGKHQNFKKLQLLWYLYYLDKDPHVKRRAPSTKDDEKSVVFLDLLAKPRLENVNTSLPVKSIYGDQYGDVSSKIQKVVRNHADISYRLKQIDARWQHFITTAMFYSVGDASSNDPAIYLTELRRIRFSLNNTLYSKIKRFTFPRKPDEFTPQRNAGRSILEDFWCIINAHPYICKINSDIIVDTTMDVSPKPSNEYVNRLQRFESKTFTWKELKQFKKKVKDQEEEFGANHLKKMCLKSDNPTLKMEKDYKYALERAENIAKLVGLYLDIDFNEQIETRFLVAIIQEIMHVKANAISIKNDYIRYKNKKQSLLSAANNPKYVSPLVIYAWQKGIVDRIFSNMGYTDLDKEQHKLEHVVYGIKKFIFSFPNIDDMELVSDELYKRAWGTIPGIDKLAKFCDIFYDLIRFRLDEQTCLPFRVRHSERFLHKMELLKVLSVHDNQITLRIVDQLVEKISEMIEKGATDEIIEAYTLHINEYPHLTESKSENISVDFKTDKSRKKLGRTFELICFVNLTKREIIFEETVEITDENSLDRLVNLGILKSKN